MNCPNCDFKFSVMYCDVCDQAVPATEIVSDENGLICKDCDKDLKGGENNG